MTESTSTSSDKEVSPTIESMLEAFERFAKERPPRTEIWTTKQMPTDKSIKIMAENAVTVFKDTEVVYIVHPGTFAYIERKTRERHKDDLSYIPYGFGYPVIDMDDPENRMKYFQRTMMKIVDNMINSRGSKLRWPSDLFEDRRSDILSDNLCPDHPEETDCEFRVTDTWRGWVIDCTHEGCDHFVEYDAAEGE